MNHLNKVIIQGNLVQAPEFKDLGNSQLCKFTLASNRKYKDTEEACFVDIITWGNLASLCDKYLSKGKPVLVEGRLKQDKWETPDGQKRSRLTIVANEVVFLPRSEKNEGGTAEKQSNVKTEQPKPVSAGLRQASPITVEDVKDRLVDLPF